MEQRNPSPWCWAVGLCLPICPIPWKCESNIYCKVKKENQKTKQALKGAEIGSRPEQTDLTISQMRTQLPALAPEDVVGRIWGCIRAGQPGGRRASRLVAPEALPETLQKPGKLPVTWRDGPLCSVCVWGEIPLNLLSSGVHHVC